MPSKHCVLSKLDSWSTKIFGGCVYGYILYICPKVYTDICVSRMPAAILYFVTGQVCGTGNIL